MKKPDIRGLFKNSRSLRAGSYSFATSAVTVAIAVFANLFAAALPESVTKIDLTSQGLYSLSPQTESIAAALEDEVKLYWIVQPGQEDSMLETLLGRYESLSRNISVIKKDPDVYPTFAANYTDGAVYNNSIVAESGNRSRYISYTELYETDYSNYYYTGSYNVSFNGENEISSAIDFVTSEDVPVVYALTGHGEAEMSASYETAVAEDNVELKTLSIITENTVPEDADCVLIISPQSDISAEELDILKNYMNVGGSIVLITNPTKEKGLAPNLAALTSSLGMSTEEGIVVERSHDNYAFGAPYYLLPDYCSHEITEELSANGYYVLMPIAHGIVTDDDIESGYSVLPLLRTSASAYSKAAGYEMTTYEKEDGDREGQFVLSAIAEKSTGEGKSCFVWIASYSILDDQTNLQVAGGNEDFFLNCISYICGEESNISIRAKSLSYDYLTMTSSQSSFFRMLIVAVIPAAFVIAGIMIRVRRKHR